MRQPESSTNFNFKPQEELAASPVKRTSKFSQRRSERNFSFFKLAELMNGEPTADLELI